MEFNCYHRTIWECGVVGAPHLEHCWSLIGACGTVYVSVCMFLQLFFGCLIALQNWN